MDTEKIIQSQYYAALEMLKQAIVRCPDSLWDAAEDKNKFWHVAYHTLFYTHLYLQENEKAFIPWDRHRDEYQFLGPIPFPPHNMPNIGESYTKDDVLTYLSFVQKQVEELVPSINPEAESGFFWLSFNKLELQLYNIRHIQQHTGELYERLGVRAGAELDWVSQTPEYLSKKD